LEHSIEKAVILSDYRVVQADDLLLKKFPVQGTGSSDMPSSFDDYEKSIIRNALLRNMGNLSNAARELGISRPTMYKKIKEYGL
jgi:two-component system response regulator HydG